MAKSSPAIRWLFVLFILGIGLAPRICSAQAQPLRIANLPIGAHCFGLNPCTFIDPFGLRLRAAVLAVFRPEKGHDRDFYAARIQIAPSITLMGWAELGLAIPITLYSKEIGVTAIYEPLEPFARVRLPLDGVLGGVATTAFVRVHIASGPFAGGLPPLPTLSELMAQAIQSYRPQTQFEAGLAFLKRIGPVAATGSIGAAVSTGRLEVYGGGELSYRLSIMSLFIQGQGIGVPQCPPQEAALNFCARGFRFGAGARFDWDLGGGGMMVATGSGAVEPGWEVGGQFGLDYDETTRRRHGDGVEAAQKWWDRRFDAMARGWAEWQSAAAMWPEDQVPLHVGPRRPGPFSGLIEGVPPASSAWFDSLLTDSLPDDPLSTNIASSVPHQEAGFPTVRTSSRRSAGRTLRSSYAAVRQAARSGQRAGIPTVPAIQIHGADPDWMKAEELERLWHTTQEQMRDAEQRQWHDSIALPPAEKAVLNLVATAPYRLGLGLLALSGPGRADEAKRLLRQVRPLSYTPAEQDAGEAMEDALSDSVTMMGMGAAEQLATRGLLLAAARQGAEVAGYGAEFAAGAERAGLGPAAETGLHAAEPSGPRFAGLLDRLPPRLNPMNYRICGIGCGGGGVEFGPPKLPTSAASGEAAGAIEGEVRAVAEHEAPVLGEVQTGSSPTRGIYEFPDQTAGGRPYVGQSSNLPQRLKQHEGAGRLISGTERTTSVDGGKTAREIVEHQRIQEITGGEPARLSPNVANKVDPIGPSRQHLLDHK